MIVDNFALKLKKYFFVLLLVLVSFYKKFIYLYFIILNPDSRKLLDHNISLDIGEKFKKKIVDVSFSKLFTIHIDKSLELA